MKKRGKSFFAHTTVLIAFLLVLSLIAYANPTALLSIFTNPTLSNATISVNDSATINVSINGTNITTITFNWNYTNYTLYDDNLIFYAGLNNNSQLSENDSYVADHSIYNYNATPNGGVFYTQSQPNQGMYFDGDSDYIGLGSIDSSSAHLNITNQSFTMSIWANWSGSVYSRCLFCYTDPGTQTTGFVTSNSANDGDFLFTIHNGSTGITLRCNDDPVAHEWYHLLGTYNGTHAQLFRNGELCDETAIINRNDVSGDTLSIGMERTTDADSSWQGTLDEPMIWNRSFNASEAYQIYSSQIEQVASNQWNVFINRSKNSTQGLDNGTYTYSLIVQNSTDTNETPTRELIINTGLDLAPTSTLSIPLNNSEYEMETVLFECNATDSHQLENITLHIWNETDQVYENTTNISGSSNQTQFNFTFITFTNYTWSCQVEDNASFVTWGENRSIIITTDQTPPRVTIDSPANIAYSSVIVDFNLTLDEDGLSCVLSLDNFASNLTMTNHSSTTYGYTNSSMDQGNYTASFSCNDTNGNRNSTETINFIIDTTFPSFTDEGGNNNSILSGEEADFNVSVANTNGSVFLEINGINYSASNTSEIFNVTLSLDEGIHTYRWISFGNGLANNVNESASLEFWVNANCSDSVVSAFRELETCDDGNLNDGDGCSSSCYVEPGYWCMLEPSNCSIVQWQPPIGIPYPEFGLEENHSLYSTINYSYSSGDAPYSDSGYGPYSHFVNNSDPSCSDSNTYGNQSEPRCSIPSNLQEGSVVELHGIGHEIPNNVVLNGSAAYPIFIRGVAEDQKPSINSTNTISDDNYLILENVILNGTGFSIAEEVFGISFRKSEVTNFPMPAYCPDTMLSCGFSSIFNTGGSSGWSEGERIEQVIVYNNTFHNNGDYFPTYESGVHAVSLAGATYRAWIIDNEIYNISEDGLQIFWFSSGDRGPPAQFVYIGRNNVHDTGENAFDIKQSYDVIISENNVYNYRSTDFPNSGSDGASIVLNDDSPNDRLWVIYNKIHNVPLGIRSQSGGDSFIIGNEFYYITREPYRSIPSSLGLSYGVGIWASASNNFSVVGNTYHFTEGGYHGFNGQTHKAVNNIFSSKFTAAAFHLGINDGAITHLNTTNNLFHQINGSNSTSGVDYCFDCLESDPLFVNTPLYCDHITGFDTTVVNGSIGTSFLAGYSKTAITTTELNFTELGIVEWQAKSDLINISSPDINYDCPSAGECPSFMSIFSYNDSDIVIGYNITNSTGDVNFSVKYYPPTTTEIYLNDTSNYASGDYIEYGNDGIARQIVNVSTDSRGNKITVDTPIASIRYWDIVCNWQGNSNVTEDFRLSSSSPAIDTAVPHVAYTIFYDLYGINISVDHLNISKDRDGDSNAVAAWDIGAHEHVITTFSDANPVVSLSSPANSTTTPNTTITFSASFTDDQSLSNVSLYIWNSTGAVNISIDQLMGTSNSTSINYTFSNSGTYLWNYLAIDNASNNSYATNNYTLIISASALCGDGVIEESEQCDDNSTANGDGCSSACQIEPGYWCMLEPSNCTQLNWTSPLGIPYPSFGIEEGHHMYANQTYNYSNVTLLYKDAGNGPYTHLVNNTSPNCISCTLRAYAAGRRYYDCGNDYGNLSEPLCNPPMIVPEGSVVEVHGGLYNFSDNRMAIIGIGSRERPVFIRYMENTTITHAQFEIMSNFTILEGFNISLGYQERGSMGFRLYTGSEYEYSQYSSIRRSEITDSEKAGTIIANYGIHNVIYNNYVHDNWDTDSAVEALGSYSGPGSNNTWIVDNEYENLSSAGVQMCHGCSTSPPNNAYIGRNTIHGNREIGMAFKYANYSVVSENIFYNHQSSAGDGWASSSDGSCLVVGADGGPTDVWILANTFYNCTHGIRVEDGYGVKVIHNVFHSLNNSAFYLDGTTTPEIYLLFNTFYDIRGGITGWRDTGSSFIIENNILSNFREVDPDASNEYQDPIRFGNAISDLFLNNNLFYDNGDPLYIRRQSVYTFNSTNATLLNENGNVSRNIIADPQFLDESSINFSLAGSSAAISNATSDYFINLSNEFYARFGVNISRDFENKIRPLDDTFDIGALEYVITSFFDESPEASLSDPANGTSTTNTTITFTGTFTDDQSLSNVSLYIWNSTDEMNISIDQLTGMSNTTSLNYTFLTSGTYFWNYLATDNASNSTYASNNFTLTITSSDANPGVILVSPSNNSQVPQLLNFSANFTDDIVLSNSTFYLWNSTEEVNITTFQLSGTTNSSTIEINLSRQGTYTWGFVVVDNNSQMNTSENYTVSYQENYPSLQIYSPRNKIYHNRSPIRLRYHAYDTDLDSVWYRVFNGSDDVIANTTLTSNTTFIISEGNFTLFLYANDSNGNTNVTNQSFAVNNSRQSVRYEKFHGKGESTNLDALTEIQLETIASFTLHRIDHGRIQFLGTINLSNSSIDSEINLDEHINITQNYIFINSTVLPSLNTSANLSIANLSFSNPRILKDGEVCPSSICIQLSYSGGTLNFSVTEFSSYSTEETPSTSTSESGSSGGGGGGGAFALPQKDNETINETIIDTQKGEQKEETEIIGSDNSTPSEDLLIPSEGTQEKLPEEEQRNAFPTRLIILVVVLTIATFLFFERKYIMEKFKK